MRYDHLEVIEYTDSNYLQLYRYKKVYIRLCVSLARGMISWKSAKQLVIAAST